MAVSFEKIDNAKNSIFSKIYTILDFCKYFIKKINDSNANNDISKSPLAGIQTTENEKSGCNENIKESNNESNLSYFNNTSK